LNIRSFISIDVSIKDRINALQNRILVEENWKIYQVKPVEKQNFHFCIIFLGEVTPATLEGLKQKLLGLKFEPFRVFYTGLGVFPNTNNPRN
jgi:2'-5' RNA ligase